MLQLDLKSGVPICNQIVNGFIKLKALGCLRATTSYRVCVPWRPSFR